MFAPAASAASVIPGSSIDFAGYLRAVGGSALNGATSIDFVNGPGGVASPGVAGTVNSYGSGTGSFTGSTCGGGACGIIADITNFTVGAQAIANFFSLSGGSTVAPINFDLTGITNINRSDPNFLTFTATGNLRYDGFDSSPATFLFSAQGGTATSFSATVLTSAVPEAATWSMMILGFGVVGFASRRRGAMQARVRFA